MNAGIDAESVPVIYGFRPRSASRSGRVMLRVSVMSAAPSSILLDDPEGGRFAGLLGRSQSNILQTSSGVLTSRTPFAQTITTSASG